MVSTPERALLGRTITSYILIAATVLTNALGERCEIADTATAFPAYAND